MLILGTMITKKTKSIQFTFWRDVNYFWRSCHSKVEQSDRGGWQGGRSRKCRWLYFRPLVRASHNRPFSTFPMLCPAVVSHPTKSFSTLHLSSFLPILFASSCCSYESQVIQNQFINNWIPTCNGLLVWEIYWVYRFSAVHWSNLIRACLLIGCGDPSSLSTCDGWLATKFLAYNEPQICPVV